MFYGKQKITLLVPLFLLASCIAFIHFVTGWYIVIYPYFMPVFIIIGLAFLAKFFNVFYEKVTLQEDRIKYRKLKFVRPQTYEIPYNKVNDVNMTKYLPGLAIITIKTGNDKGTKLKWIQRPSELKETILKKSQ